MLKRTKRIWFLALLLLAAVVLAVALLWFRTLGWGEALVILIIVLVLAYQFGRGVR